jgi:hypothetical protein
LREHLWPADATVDFNHGLDAAINKLREALERFGLESALRSQP